MEKVKGCSCKNYFRGTKYESPPSPQRFIIVSEGVQCGECLGWYKYLGKYISNVKGGERIEKV